MPRSSAGTRAALAEQLAAVRQRLVEFDLLDMEPASADEALRAIAEEAAPVTGSDFFKVLVRQLAAALGVRYALVTKCADPDFGRVRALAFWIGDGHGETFEYSLEHTPCEAVVAGRLCYYPDELQRRFPVDRDLVEMGAQSYVGLPLFDSAGKILGHLAVLDDKPLDIGQRHRHTSVLKLFAARTASELERKHREEELLSVVRELQQALATVKTLRALLPMCAWCRKVRDDGGYWDQLENYVREHAEVRFTHGICPECRERMLK